MTAVDSNPKDAKEAKDKEKSPKKVKVKTLATQSEVKVDASKTQETETSDNTLPKSKKENSKGEDKRGPRNRKRYFCNAEHFMSRCKEFRNYKQVTELPTSMKMESVSDVSAKVTLQTYAERP